LFCERVLPVVHKETTVTFDVDQTGATGPPSQFLHTPTDDVEMLDVLRIEPKVDPPPPV
jgi:hypothetical protein